MKNILKAAFCCYVAIGAIAQVKADNLDQMISPVSHPVTFEDPRHSTEIRAIFAYHQIDDKFVTGGGDAQVYAVQARLKLTDDLSFIATKDGFVVLHHDGVVDDDEGFNDVAAGLKYSIVKDTNYIISTGLKYEIPLAKKEVFQGQGDGALNPFVSAAYTMGELNLMAGSGLRMALDDTDSSLWDLDVHADYKIGNFYPLVEVNLIHPYSSGDRLPIADEGEDFFNFGATQSAGKNILSSAVGARYRITDDIDCGIAYQFPLDRTEGSRILDWRITSDLIVRF
ncbi:MAG: autotransporter domain-containing protein [Proteobacteria bacterium]|nr:autotransporter domain-containing protein [Pseudomonadota bacterium]